jgi:hypothetical protein
MKKHAVSKGFSLAGVAAVAICFLTVGSVIAEAGVVKYTPNMRMTDLAGRPDTDHVEFSGGRRVSVGDLRRLTATAQQMRAAAPGSRLPATLKIKPAATGTRINNASDLAAALKRSDNETVQFPSGRLATVGQVKLLQPLVEKQLGRKLTAAPLRPNLAGPAIKVSQSTTKDEWKGILQKPDSTVIESPSGKRITVGELKQTLRTTPTRERRDGK